MHKTSTPEDYYFKSFAKFKRKQLWQNLFFNKVGGLKTPAQVLSCEHLRAAAFIGLSGRSLSLSLLLQKGPLKIIEKVLNTPIFIGNCQITKPNRTKGWSLTNAHNWREILKIHLLTSRIWIKSNRLVFDWGGFLKIFRQFLYFQGFRSSKLLNGCLVVSLSKHVWEEYNNFQDSKSIHTFL